MQTFILKTHKIGKDYVNPHFFILNKGNNSGKPLENHCANCFVMEFKTLEEKESYYWLFFGLWQSKTFHQYLRGSVIPFIILDDVKSCIKSFGAEVLSNSSQFQKSIASLRTLEEVEKNYKKNLLLIAEAKRLVFYKYVLRR
jgi:hypothetical protein